MAVTQLSEPGSVPAAPLRTLVVLPTLDEAENIRAVLGRIRVALPEGDVLVVDDGSTDGTPELAEAAAAALGQISVLRRTGPRGLGPAYRAGLGVGLAHGYDVLVQMDADLSHDPAVLPTLVAEVRRGADLVIGSRYVTGGETPGWPARRRLLSRAGGGYARLLLGLDVRDVTSGYRAYRADLVRAVDLDAVTTDGYGFQIEMTHRARRVGAVIREVPIVFRDRTAGESKMSGRIIREALLMVTRRAFHDRVRRSGPMPEVRPIRPVDPPAPIELVRSPSAAVHP
ncbi:MAG: polyprenol monophosphomannose synthase [Acidimicrobiia bacterium]